MGVDVQLQTPWAHLRKLLPEESYCYSDGLNRIRKKELIECFSKFFPINLSKGIDKNHNKRGGLFFKEEGPERLSDKIKSELSEYSNEELLTRSFLLIGRKS